MTTFLGFAALMIAAALAFVLVPLLRHARNTAPIDDTRRLRALDEALASGVIDADEYAAKRAALASKAAHRCGDAPRSRATFTALARRRARAAGLGAVALSSRRRAARRSIPRISRRRPKRRRTARRTWRRRSPASPQSSSSSRRRARLGAARPRVCGDESRRRSARRVQAGARARAGRRRCRRRVRAGARARGARSQAAGRIARADRSRDREGREEPARAVAARHQRLSERRLRERDRALEGAAAAAAARFRCRAQRAQRDRRRRSAPRRPRTAAAGSGAGRSARRLRANASSQKHPQSGAVERPASPSTSRSIRSSRRSSIPTRRCSCSRAPSADRRCRSRSSGSRPSQLPATVTLDDSMSMMPAMKLSKFPQVVVGARVSKSGNAMPQSGDLQVLSPPLESSRSEPIVLTIDQVVP